MSKFAEAKLSFITPEDSSQAAGHMMQELGFRHLPVLENDELKGVVSDRDVVRAELLEKASGHQVLVREIMHSPPVTIQKDETIMDAITTMRNRKINSVVVMEGSRVLTILTTTDMLALLQRMLLNKDKPVQEILTTIGMEKHDLASFLDNLEAT